VAADGNYIPNEGQITFSLEKESTKFKSTLQVAGSTQTLMSVGRICDMGHKMLSTTTEASVQGAKTGEYWDRTGVLFGGVSLKPRMAPTQGPLMDISRIQLRL